MTQENKTGKIFTLSNVVSVVLGVVLALAGRVGYDYVREAEETKEAYNLTMLKNDLTVIINESIEASVKKLEDDLKTLVSKEAQEHVLHYRPTDSDL